MSVISPCLPSLHAFQPSAEACANTVKESVQRIKAFRDAHPHVKELATRVSLAAPFTLLFCILPPPLSFGMSAFLLCLDFGLLKPKKNTFVHLIQTALFDAQGAHSMIKTVSSIVLLVTTGNLLYLIPLVINGIYGTHCFSFAHRSYKEDHPCLV